MAGDEATSSALHRPEVGGGTKHRVLILLFIFNNRLHEPLLLVSREDALLSFAITNFNWKGVTG